MKNTCIVGFALTLSVAAGAQSSDPQTFQRNLRWAEAGQVQAEVTVGRDYLRGGFVPMNIEAARHWFSTASAAGAKDADAWLAYMAIHGQGVPKDEAGGISLLVGAASAGSVKAKTLLAQTYESGRGWPKDLVTAAQLYKEASAAGDSDAMAGLGNLYIRGTGVARDEAEGVRLLRLSSSQGNEWGEVFLASYLLAGESDNAKQQHATLLLKASAAQKNPEALFRLGTLAEKGELIPQDPKAARDYYIKAANQNFLPAERELAAVFASGLGVNKNDSAAYFWATVAAAQGDAKSIALAEIVKPRLTQADLANIQEHVIKFLAGDYEVYK